MVASEYQCSRRTGRLRQAPWSTSSFLHWRRGLASGQGRHTAVAELAAPPPWYVQHTTHRASACARAALVAPEQSWVGSLLSSPPPSQQHRTIPTARRPAPSVRPASPATSSTWLLRSCLDQSTLRFALHCISGTLTLDLIHLAWTSHRPPASSSSSTANQPVRRWSIISPTQRRCHCRISKATRRVIVHRHG